MNCRDRKKGPLLLTTCASLPSGKWGGGEESGDFVDSMTNVKKMEPLIDERINHWIGKVDELFAKTHQKMDFAPWAVYVAYDIISEVGFGELIDPTAVTGSGGGRFGRNDGYTW